MEVTIELINHLSELSRLNFTEEEKIEFKNDLKKTLEQFDELSTVNTDNINLSHKIIDAENLREDIIKPSLDNGEVIKNAPKHSHGAIVVPTVVE